MSKINDIPIPIPEIPPADAERFWKLVDKTPGYGPHGDCWKWIGPPYSNAIYGHFWFKKRTWIASRIAYFLSTGEDPWPLLVCHTCDTPLCCNPGHFFKGTVDQNIADRVSKGRTSAGENHPARIHPEIRQGEKNGRAILGEAEVEFMRVWYSTGLITQGSLANMMGMSYCQTNKILRHAPGGWSHLK